MERAQARVMNFEPMDAVKTENFRNSMTSFRAEKTRARVKFATQHDRSVYPHPNLRSEMELEPCFYGTDAGENSLQRFFLIQ